MIKYVYKAAIIAGTAAAVLGLDVSAADQGIKIEIEKITVEDMVYTPFYRVDTEQDHEPGSAARWIRLGVYFRTEGGWIDELEITQMALKPIVDTGKKVVLAETVQYINLEPGDHYVYVYLHPSYVKRYEISDDDLDSAVVIRLDGKEAAHMETAEHGEPGWSSVAGDTSAKGYLLNHAETPFWFINYDFKEVIKR